MLHEHLKPPVLLVTSFIGRLSYMPNEIIDLILKHLEKAVILNFMRTSRKSHAIGARLLYHDITIHGLRARRLFLTLLTPPNVRSLLHAKT